MTRALILAFILTATWSTRPCVAQEIPPEPPSVLNDEGLLRKYVWSTLGVEGSLHATFWSAFEQWRGAPPEWRTNATGYAKRWTSEYAESAVASTTKYAVARLMHHDPSFTRCQCTGTGPRLRHAMASPFTARTPDGRTVVSPAIVAGLAAGSIIPAATWYPAPNGVRDGVAHAASGVAAKMAVDVFREFVRVRWRP